MRCKPQRHRKMTDTSVELKGLERTAESVRRREGEPLALLSAGRASSSGVDLGSISTTQEARMEKPPMVVLSGHPHPGAEAPGRVPSLTLEKKLSRFG